MKFENIQTTACRVAAGRPRGARQRPAPAILACLLSSVALPAAAEAPHDAATPGLQRLEELAGSFITERVEFLGPDGAVRRVSSAAATNEFDLDRQVLVHRGRLRDPAIEVLAWYFRRPGDGRLHMASVSSTGRYDEFVGGWQGGRLVMVSVPGAAADDRIFRMTHSAITADSYDEMLEVSADGGTTWRTSNRQTMHRLDPAAVLVALQRYTGRWRSDEKTTSAGEKLHFGYDMHWLDAGQTIARIVISRIDAGGNVTTVFEGYKGREPDGNGVYYHAASPSGRGSRGEVVLDGDDVVTHYDGWTADGATVRIRDVFEPASEGRFTSRTYMRRPGDSGWRQIGEDHWTRSPHPDSGPHDDGAADGG